MAWLCKRLSLNLLDIETMEEVEILVGTVRVGFMGVQPRQSPGLGTAKGRTIRLILCCCLLEIPNKS